jgi:hypothetical protein
MRIRLPLGLAAALAALTATASPAAAVTTIGDLPALTPPAICTSGVADIAQQSVSTGPGFTVPAGYTTLTSWSTYAAAGAGQEMSMKVFRKAAEPNKYVVVGHDGPHPLVPGQVNTFTTKLQVQAGDLVGLNDRNSNVVNNACLVETGKLGDVFIAAAGDAPDGGPMEPIAETAGYRLNLRATLDRAATIASVSPATGPVAGGTLVTVSGLDLSSTSAVSIGGVPAAAFLATSDSTLTVVTPPAAKPGAVGLIAVNSAGASAGATFTYHGCVVPKLTGRKLKGARKALAGAECALGKVRGKAGGRVRAQSLKPGTVVASGTKVDVKLKKNKKRRR